MSLLSNASYIASQYASAVFDLCNGDINKAEHILRDLKRFTKIKSELPSFYKLLLNATVSASIKLDMIKSIDVELEKIGYKMDRMTVNLITVMILNNRSTIISRVRDKLAEIISKAQGLIVANVTLASHAITDEHREFIVEQLSLITGQQVDVRFDYDAKMLCGIKINIGNYQVDFSAASMMHKIHCLVSK